MSRLRLWLVPLVVLALTAAVTAQSGSALRQIGQLRLAILGLSAVPDPAAPVVPRNTQSGVRIVVRGGAGELDAADVARFLGGDVAVEGELVGPKLTEPVALTSADGADRLLLPLPALATAGDYTLSNLRLTAGGRPVLDVTPGRLTVRVIEQVLITSVRTRPLTLQEIQDKGIVLDSDDYLGFEFTMGLKLESKPVQITFPVVFDKDGTPLPEFTRPAPNLPPLDVDIPQLPEIVPTMLRLEPIASATPISPLVGVPAEEIRIPSVLVIPGSVGYLKQFFSAQLFVANGTPVGARLTVRDLAGTIHLPDGDDHQPGTGDDPLSLPETVAGQAPGVLPIRTIGPDGQAGTPDDGGTIAASEQAQAEFLVRGEREGFHTLDFDIEGVLDGLPVGPVRVSGTAKGGVLVRNPYFDVTFTVPAVVRRGEPFRLFATVTNIGQGLANDVNVTLDASRMSGAHLVGDGTQQIDTLRGGDARTLEFQFQSERTGQVVASYLRFDTTDGSSGDVRFTLGVGERGVALSPDTLVLPAAVDTLPQTVVEAAMRVLGQAWSLANAPPNTLPSGVRRVSRTVATEKALALAEAGLRVTLGQAVASAVRDVGTDFYGGSPVDLGFDQLLRETDAGRNLARAIGGELADPVLAAGGALAYERALSRLAASGPDFVAIGFAPAGAADLTLTDAAGRRTTTVSEELPDGTSAVPPDEVPSAVLVPLETGGGAAAVPRVGLVSQPTASPYTLDLAAPAATAADLSVTLPRGDGTFVRGSIGGVAIDPLVTTRLVVDLARPDTLAVEQDADGNGTFEISTPLVLETILPEGPTLVSATVIGPETISTAGPFGLHAAVLFDRVVDAATAGKTTNYAIPANAVRIARRQLSGRLVFLQLEQPEGPYVPTTVSVSGIADGRRIDGPPASVPLGSRLVDPGAVVTGRVFQADGAAVGAGVIRYINNLDVTCQSGLPDVALAARPLGADGAFEFRYVRQDPCSLPFRLFTIDPVTYAIRTLDSRVRTAGERIVLDLALFGTGAVSGTVRDALGAPVGGAIVRVQSRTDYQVQGATISDGDGRYTVAGITVGPVSVSAQKALTVGTAAGAILRAGTTASVDVTLDTGTASLSGAVRRLESGVVAPAGGALVQFFQVVSGPPRLVGAVLTAADGGFSFPAVPAGAYMLQATYAGLTYEMASVSGVLAQGQDVTGLDLVIEAAATATVSGTVRLPGGAPAAGVVVALGDRGTVTGADGTYALPLVPIRPDRPQAIEAFTEDHRRRGQTSVVVTGPVVGGVDITLSALGTAEITVLQGGVPVADQEVVVLADPHLFRGLCSTGCGCALATGRTDAAGFIRFDDLPVGRVRTRATRTTGGFVDVAESEFSITGDGVTGYGVLRLAGAGTLTGTVIGPDGHLAFGADVVVRSRTYSPASCTLAPGDSHHVRTDVNGRFNLTTVAVGPASITATDPFSSKSAGVQVVLTEAGQAIDVSLTIPNTTAGELSGVVYLPDGVTPAGAGVEVTANGYLPDVTVRTDDTGLFRFAKIFPAGTYTLTARDPATGGLARDIVVLKADQDFAHDLRLKGRGTVRVSVVTAAGDPTSAFVRLAETQFPNRTYEGAADAANGGVVTFDDVFEGPLAVTASDVYARGGRASTVLPGPGDTIDVTVTLTVTGTVEGRFLMPDGATPVPFATVRLLAAGKVVGQATTGGAGDSLGRYRFTYVPAGALRIEAQDPLTARTGFAVGQLQSEGEVVTLDVLAQSLGTVEGTVTGGGAPQPAARVDLTSGTFRVSALTGADGRYRVEGVPAGKVSVVASVAGGLLSGTAAATLDGEGDVLTLDVALRDTGTITGHVVPAPGTALPPTVVTLAVSGVTARISTAADAAGAFTFERVPAGLVTLTADAIGSVDAGRLVATVPALDTIDVTLPLAGVGSIQGVARDSAGQPVAGDVTISGTGDFPYSLTVTADAGGAFGLPQVIAGPFTARLVVRTGGFILYGTAAGEVAPGADPTLVDVRLQDTGTVAGRVLRADGVTPALGAEVRLRITGGPETVVQAQADGRFTAVGVPLGALTLRVSDPFTGGAGLVTGLALLANGDAIDTGDIVLDDSPVAVAATEPSDGATNVAVTTPVRITFSDPLQSTFGFQVKRGATTVGFVPSLSADQRVVTLAPAATAGWPDGADITVTVTTNVTDVYGRRLAVPFVVTFRTTDLTPPQVVALAPADDAIEVDVGTAITVTFDEPLAATTPFATLVTLSVHDGPVVAGTAAWPSPAVVVFTPDAPLTEDTRYDVVVVGAVDLANNGQTAPVTASFSTPDHGPPALWLTSPATVGWVPVTRPGIVVGLFDPVSGVDIATATLAVDGVLLPAVASGDQIAHTMGTDLAQGGHVVTASARDRAGNLGTLATTFVIDTVPPDPAVITGVSEGEFVSGVVTIGAVSADAVSGVSRIEIYRDGTNSRIATLGPPAFEAAIDTHLIGEGTHSLSGRAIDNAEHAAANGPPVTIVVNNVPLTITILSPAAGTAVRDSVTVTAGTNETVERVEFAVGGALVVDTTLPYAGTLDLSAVAAGPQTIAATAYAATGEVASATVSILIDRTPPPAPDQSRISAEPPEAGSSLVVGRGGAVEALAHVEIANLANAATATAAAAADGSFATSIAASMDDVLALVAVDPLGNPSDPTLVIVRRTPSLPPPTGSTTLAYEGLVADRVGPGAAALGPDGALDGVFTFSVAIGDGVTRQLAYLDLVGPATRSTRASVGSILGVAADAGAPLLNGLDGEVGFPVTSGITLSLIAADEGFVQEGASYTATAVFTDGSRFVGTATIVPAADRALVAHSARVSAVPAMVEVPAGGQGTATVTIDDIRDIEGTRVPDGAKIAIAVADLASDDPRGAAIRSAGGVILDGDPAPNNAAFRVFTIAGGTVTAAYASDTVAPAPITGALAVVQVLAADADGNVLGTRAVATLDLNLRQAADQALVEPVPPSIYFDKSDRRVAVSVRVRDAAGNPVPDGTKVAVTANGNVSTGGGPYIQSVGGTIVGGTPYTTTFKIFSVLGGRVDFEYSAETVSLSIVAGTTYTATIQVLPVNPATGAPMGSVAIGTATVSLATAAGADMHAIPPSVPYVFPAPLSQIVVGHVHDSRGNLVPDGARFLVTAASNVLAYLGTYVASDGGAIVDGEAAATNYRAFTLAGGRFLATYAPASNMYPAPGQVKTARVQVAMAKPDKTILGNQAVSVGEVKVVAPWHAVGAADPPSLLADGRQHTATVTFAPVLDGWGNPIPDGSKVVASVGNLAGIYPTGQSVPSAGGQILNGSGTNATYPWFTVENGAVTILYGDQTLTSLPVPGATATANVTLFESDASGNKLSGTVIGVVPITLVGLTSADVAASPAALHADGADRRSTVTISDLRDGAGNPVPDGTLVGVSAANSAARTPDGTTWIASAGGTIVGGEAISGSTFRAFPVTNGQVVVEYSCQGIVPTSPEVTAVVTVVPVRPSGTGYAVISPNVVGTAAIRLVLPVAATVTVTPVDVLGDAGAHLVQVVLSNLADAGGFPIPDGARIGLSAANLAARDSTSAYIVSEGGDILSAGTFPDDGNQVSTNFRMFTVAGGEVHAVYSSDGKTAGVNETRTARIVAVPLSAAGAVASQYSFATGSVEIHGLTFATASGPATAVAGGDPVTVTFSGLKDAAGNTVPDGTLVAATVANGALYDPTTNAAIPSAGATIADGTVAPDPRFRLFAVTGGSVTITVQPTAAGTARLSLAPAKPDGTVIGIKALIGGTWAIAIQ